jgi:hypothetical protein
MVLTVKKYGFPASSFSREPMFLGKLKANSCGVLSQNLIFFKTTKTLCTTLKRLTEIEYESHINEIRIFKIPKKLCLAT